MPNRTLLVTMLAAASLIVANSSGVKASWVKKALASSKASQASTLPLPKPKAKAKAKPQG